MLARLLRYLRARKYTAGQALSQFVAPDVRRDVEIVDVTELEQGYVTARIRTWNVLYAIRRSTTPGPPVPPELGPPRRIAVTELWRWEGHAWGGEIPADDAPDG